MATKKTYIVASCDSDCDGVSVSRVRGTVAQVKEYLVELVEECKENWGDYESGSETVEEVKECRDGSLYAYVNGYDHHADINAYPEDSLIIEEL